MLVVTILNTKKWVKWWPIFRYACQGGSNPWPQLRHCQLSIVLGVNGWVQWNGSRALLPLTRQKCNIIAKAALRPLAEVAGIFQTPTSVMFQNFCQIRLRRFFKFENPTPIETPKTN